MRNLHFELINETTPKHETFPIGMLEFEHDFALEDIVRTNQCMKELKCEGDIGGDQGSKQFKHLFIGTRTCIQVVKKLYAFFVYVILALDPTQQHEMLIQYL